MAADRDGLPQLLPRLPGALLPDAHEISVGVDGPSTPAPGAFQCGDASLARGRCPDHGAHAVYGARARST